MVGRREEGGREGGRRKRGRREKGREEGFGRVKGIRYRKAVDGEITHVNSESRDCKVLRGKYYDSGSVHGYGPGLAPLTHSLPCADL